MSTLKIGILTIASLFFMSCQEKKPVHQNVVEIKPEKISLAKTPVRYKKGDVVPANLVCMVNNAFMGKQQLEVPFGGKMYYGCCEMCRKRIPEDAASRQAKDPLTLKKVDKATAYIVLIGDNGEVAYFENEGNYAKFKKHNGV